MTANPNPNPTEEAHPKKRQTIAEKHSSNALSSILFNVFLAAVTHAVLVRVSEDPEIERDLVHLEEAP